MFVRYWELADGYGRGFGCGYSFGRRVFGGSVAQYSIVNYGVLPTMMVSEERVTGVKMLACPMNNVVLC